LKSCVTPGFFFTFKGHRHESSIKLVSASTQHLNQLCLDEVA
jgi:hypothetical protein